MQNTKGRRPVFLSIIRGFLRRCPNCGGGRVFEAYLKPAHACDACGESYHQIRTDDFAPWLTILIAGHLIVPVALYFAQNDTMAYWMQLSVLLPLSVGIVLGVLPFAKGSCLGLMWALGLSGDETQ